MGKYTISLQEVAKEIGNEPKTVTLPNGTQRTAVNWDQETAQQALHVIRDFVEEIAEQERINGTSPAFLIDGPAPAWFASAITHACHPHKAELNTPSGPVAIPMLGKSSSQSVLDQNMQHEGGIRFSIEEGPSAVRIHLSIESENGIYDPANLDKIKVPSVPFGKVPILDGKVPNYVMAAVGEAYAQLKPDVPNYVMAAVGEAYAHSAPYVAYYQPQIGGATVGITHDPNVHVGRVLPKQEIERLCSNHDDQSGAASGDQCIEENDGPEIE